MYRSIFYLGIFVLITSLLGLLLGNIQTSLVFLLPKDLYAIFGLVFGGLMMHFAIFDKLRRPLAKKTLGTIGAILLLLGILGGLSPSYFGIIQVGYMRIANLILMLVSGSGLLLAAIEEERPSRSSEVLSLLFNRLRSHKKSVQEHFNQKPTIKTEEQN